MQSSLYQWRTFRCLLLSSINSRTEKKNEEKTRNCFSWWSKATEKHCQSCGKNKREREGNESDQPTFSHLFPPFHLLCVFPLCCRQTALTNLWARIRRCHILSPRLRWNSNFTKDTPRTWKDHQILVNSFMLMWGKWRCFLLCKPSFAGGVLLSPSEFGFWPKI